MIWSAETLKIIRCQMGWTKSDLARRLSVRLEEIEQWEEGTAIPNSALQEKLDFFSKQAEQSMVELGQSPAAEKFLNDTSREAVNLRDIE